MNLLDKQLDALLEAGLISKATATNIKDAVGVDTEHLIIKIEEEVRASLSKIKFDFITNYT